MPPVEPVTVTMPDGYAWDILPLFEKPIEADGEQAEDPPVVEDDSTIVLHPVGSPFEERDKDGYPTSQVKADGSRR